MLYAKNVPPRFWAECMKTVDHVINRLPQARLGFISPYEKLWNVKPMVSHFRVFGCICYVFFPNNKRRKFDNKAIRCISVGYDNERKGWRCCDPITENATYQEMWCLLRRPCGSHLKKHYFLTPSRSKRICSKDFNNNQRSN